MPDAEVVAGDPVVETVGTVGPDAAAVCPVAAPRGRVVTDGKFFRLEGRKFLVKGVGYGPFARDAEGVEYPLPAVVGRDLERIRELGANVLRLYSVPPPWFLDAAIEANLRLLIDVPWYHRVCFLGDSERERRVRDAVRLAAEECAHHPATFAISLANEIPPDIVRWSGRRAIEDFLGELAGLVKQVNPDCLCTFGNFPPTEYLRPRDLDFHCFNVYLHRRDAFENYLARLQMRADTRPLVLGECGIDSLREGEERQATILGWQIEGAFRAGAAGVAVFSYTDEWYHAGRPVTDWAFGLVDRQRGPKPAWSRVRQAFAEAPCLALEPAPRVSVVVASYNGARTLPLCLEALQSLNYPDYEVLLIDDGSTDGTPDLARQYSRVRYWRHPANQGLSAARNTGIQLATGDIVAFTDADCRPDEDWLDYLVQDLLRGGYSGVGGHNLLPTDDSPVGAAVMVSPGGPTHVMLDDRVAEHLPGCNMAFWRHALLEIGGFDPVFRKAGDDVDLCWRLQAAGGTLGFSPGGFVWHYRRSRIRDYLRQQHGYGEAEALLERKHPEHFNRFGGSRWRGRLYGGQQVGPVLGRSMIYHGPFGAGLFQTLYNSAPAWSLHFTTAIEYYAGVVLPMAVLGTVMSWLLPLAALAAAVPVLVSAVNAWQVELPRRMRRVWSRPLVAWLYLLQPLVRGWARYQGRLFLRQTPLRVRRNFRAVSESARLANTREPSFSVPSGPGRFGFLDRLIRAFQSEGWRIRTDTGWNAFDLEVYGSRWSKLQLTTVAEAEPEAGLIRCRLETACTFPARMVNWLLLGLAVLLIGLHQNGNAAHWLWLALPLATSLWFRQDQRRLRGQVAVFLDRTVEGLRATRDRESAGPPG